jgi:hypothetical protein
MSKSTKVDLSKIREVRNLALEGKKYGIRIRIRKIVASKTYCLLALEAIERKCPPELLSHAIGIVDSLGNLDNRFTVGINDPTSKYFYSRTSRVPGQRVD